MCLDFGRQAAVNSGYRVAGEGANQMAGEGANQGGVEEGPIAGSDASHGADSV